MKDNNSEDLKSYVRDRVKGLADGSSRSRAMLACLRRAVGKLPGSDPGTWQAVLSGFPEQLRGHGAAPSYAEWAAHTALTLYAIHVQSCDEPVHVPGVRFGSAVGEMAADYGGSDDGGPCQKRMAEAARSNDIETLSWRLRSLVQLLGRAGIGFDYASLAGDLYWFQFESTRPKVVLMWGRDYSGSLYAARKGSENDGNT